MLCRPRMFFALCTAAMALACSDATQPDAVPEPLDTSTLTLSSSRITTAVGDTVRLRVRAHRGGVTADVTGDTAVHWRVADPTVAVVERGLVVPLSTGTTQVVASVNGQSVAASIDAFGSVRVTRLAVGQGPSGLVVGDTAALAARLAYTSGASVTLRTSLTWTSLDPAVATVSDGRLIARAPGTARVVASLQELSDTTSIRVAARPALTLAPDTLRLAPGATATLTASVVGGASLAELGALTWQSSATSVATVSTAGVVAAVGPGVAMVQASADRATAGSTVVVVSAAGGDAPPVDGPLPELPRVLLDTHMPVVTGRTIRVGAGDDLQAAINTAQPGDEIVVQAGATFAGAFTLPKKSGDGWIVIRTSGTLPPEGTRVTPASVGQMPKLISYNSAIPAIATKPGAHHYRLVGLEVTAKDGATMGYNLIALGGGGDIQRTLADVPSDIVLDRMYVHGQPAMSFQRCVMLNSARSAVVDSYLSECHGKGFDSQAIGGWNGPGPFKIVNNYLEAAGENILFGGADPSITGLTPSDIEVRHNHLIKPLAWKGTWSAKNLFELKHAQRVLLEGNVMENNWVDAQNGFAILFQALSDNNSAPWTRVRDVTVRYNIVRNSPAGVNVLSRVAYGADALMPAEPSQRIHIHDNLFLDIGTDESLGRNGRLFQLLGDLQDVRIEHNTGLASYMTVFLGGKDPQSGLVITDNVFSRGVYGIFGDGKGEGKGAISYFAPDGVVTRNIIAGARSSLYPAGNLFPSSVSAIGFVDLAADDLRLAPGSPYAVLDGGIIPGVDFSLLDRYTSGVK